ncbi:MAG TPA: tetratricopeptide repeat protein, partial [Terriglobia bacterium]|nr:tetratricopeptide repeat protein [Terriglobia bacterium]
MKLDLKFRLVGLMGRGAVAGVVVSVMAGVVGGALVLAAQQPKPLGASQIQGLVTGGVDSRRVAMLVDQRGIDFEPTPAYLEALTKAGAGPALLKSLQSARRVITATPSREPAANRGTQPMAKATKPPPAPIPSGPAPSVKPVGQESTASASASPSHTVAPAPEVTQELLFAAQLGEKKDWAGAEQQYRAALKTEPASPTIHLALGHVLAEQNQWDEAIAEYRLALASNPDDSGAHRALAVAYEKTHNIGGAIGEYRELLRLNPNDADLETRLGEALYDRGDAMGAVPDLRNAARLQPLSPEAHNRLGLAL